MSQEKLVEELYNVLFEAMDLPIAAETNKTGNFVFDADDLKHCATAIVKRFPSLLRLAIEEGMVEINKPLLREVLRGTNLGHIGEGLFVEADKYKEFIADMDGIIKVKGK